MVAMRFSRFQIALLGVAPRDHKGPVKSPPLNGVI